MELGVYTFGEVSHDPATGRQLNVADRLHDRFLIQFTVGPLPHAAVMQSIELFGTQVAPAIRQHLASVAESVAPA